MVLERGSVVADGEPREALRVLRDDYETARREHDLADARPEDLPQVSSVEVNGTPARSHVLDTGEDLLVDLTVRAGNRPLSDWLVGVGLQTTLGQVVFGTTTEMLGHDLAELPAGQERRVRLRLRAPSLGEGAYSLEAAVATRAGGELHRLPQAALVQVRSRGDQIGVLDVVTEVVEG